MFPLWTNPKSLIDQVGQSYDVIVVGSGLCGALAAKELGQSGLKVLLVERGGLLNYQGRPERPAAAETIAKHYPVQSKCGAFCDETSGLFVNDAENPYVYDPAVPFLWIRSHQVGGRSLLWSGHCYRLGFDDFNMIDPAFGGRAWPIGYADIAPWYEHVERFIGVSGIQEGFGEIPDSIFQPPLPLNACEGEFLHRLHNRHKNEIKGTIARMAILTEAIGGRPPCSMEGPCFKGCPTGALYTSLNGALPYAINTGNVQLLTNTICEKILPSDPRNIASGVQVIDLESNERFEFSSRIIFLCASTLASTQILLNSRNSDHPAGIGNNYDLVGRFLMDHVFQVGAQAEFSSSPVESLVGYKPGGVYIPRIGAPWDGKGEFRGSFGFQGAAVPLLSREDRKLRGRKIIDRWKFWLGGWGECAPSPKNRVELVFDSNDRWGMPLLKVTFKWSEHEERLKQNILDTAVEILSDVSFSNIVPFNMNAHGGLCVHEMGTARMGDDPKTSVLNKFNQVHDCPNIYITDGSCMPASHFQNPSLTYMAITARACAHAVVMMQRGGV